MTQAHLSLQSLQITSIYKWNWALNIWFAGWKRQILGREIKDLTVWTGDERKYFSLLNLDWKHLEDNMSNDGKATCFPTTFIHNVR